MSYVLILDQLERLMTPLIQAAAMARMLGSSADVPDWFEIRADFDRTLAAPPKRIDTKDEAMLVAIGLRG